MIILKSRCQTNLVSLNFPDVFHFSPVFRFRVAAKIGFGGRGGAFFVEFKVMLGLLQALIPTHPRFQGNFLWPVGLTENTPRYLTALQWRAHSIRLIRDLQIRFQANVRGGGRLALGSERRGLSGCLCLSHQGSGVKSGIWR